MSLVLQPYNARPAPHSYDPGYFRQELQAIQRALTTTGATDGLAPEYKGALGNGTSNDRPAFTQLLSGTTGDIAIVLQAGANYYLGTLTDGDGSAITFSGRNNVTIIANGATLTITDNKTVAGQDGVLKFVDCNRVSIIGTLNLRGSQTQHVSAPSGVIIVGDQVDSENYNFDNIVAQQTRSIVEVASSTANAILNNVKRVSELRLGKLTGTDCYYGLLCVQQGDHLSATLGKMTNVIRAYYCAGVDSQEVSIHTWAHPQSTADVLIATYYNDTRNIKVRYVPHGNISQDYLVRIVHYATTGPNPVAGPASGKKIENIEVIYDDSYTVGAGDGTNNWGVTLREEDTAGGIRASSLHIIDNVKIGGLFQRYYAASTVVNCPTTFARSGRLYIDPSFTSIDALLWTTTLGNFLLYVGGNKWARSIQGDLNNLKLEFDLRRIVNPASGGVQLMVKTQVGFSPDYTGTVGGGTMKMSYQEDVSAVYLNAAGTTADFGASKNIVTHNYNGYAPTALVWSQTTTGFIGATFANASSVGSPANGRAVGYIEIV